MNWLAPHPLRITLGLALLASLPGVAHAQGAQAAGRPVGAVTATLAALQPTGPVPMTLVSLPPYDLAREAPQPLVAITASVGASALLADEFEATMDRVDRVPLWLDVESCLESFLPRRRDRRLYNAVLPGLRDAARQYRVGVEIGF